MPAYAVGAACEFFRGATLQILGQQVSGAGRGRDRQTHVQQRGAVFAAVSGQHASGHGPILLNAQRIRKGQVVTPAAAVLVAGACLYRQTAANPFGRLAFAVLVSTRKPHA